MQTIRPHHGTDWTRISEIHDAARLIELRQTVGEEAFLDLAATAGPEGLFDDRLDVLEVNGTVVGFVSFDQGNVTWLYVAPDCHGRGYGRALLRHAIGEAGETVRTSVLEGNRQATALYLSEGFRVIERKEGRLAGNERFAAAGLELELSKSGLG